MRKNYAILLFFFITSICLCQVPPNDNIISAIELTQFPFTDVDVHLSEATNVTNNNLACFDNSNKRIYYKYQPSVNTVFSGAIIRNLISQEEISVFQSSVSNATSENQLTLVSELDCDLNRQVQVPLVAGNTYYIVVNDTYNSYIETDISFNISETGVNIDSYFLNLVLDLEGADINNNDQIEVVEALALKGYIQIGNLQFIDQELQVIEDETELYDLYNITYLDLSNTTLINNSIDLSQLPRLTDVDLINTQLTSLDPSQNPALRRIEINNNNVSSIDVSQNPNLTILSLDNNNLISSIDVTNNNQLISLGVANLELNNLDLTQNPDLDFLDCSGNNLEELNLTQNGNLTQLRSSSNNINSIDLSQNLLLERVSLNPMLNLDITSLSNLELLTVSGLSSIDLLNNTELETLICSNTLLTNIDLSNNINLTTLFLRDNYFLETVNIKNGNNTTLSTFQTTLSTNIQYICVDDISYAQSNFSLPSPFTAFVDDCSIIDSNNRIVGNVKYDSNNDGCDNNDNIIINQKIMTSNNIGLSKAIFTNSIGDYSFVVGEGDYTTSVSNLDTFVQADPINADNIVVGFDNNLTENFCLSATQSVSDLSVSIVPVTEARPGFNSTYKLFVVNEGTTPGSGNVIFSFDNSKQNIISSNPIFDSSTLETLSFNFSNLLPFEQMEIEIIMNSFVPPIVNDGDVLSFNVTVNLDTQDDEIDNNIFDFDQIVVNSFDPNDKLVVQGDEIFIEDIDEYLYYIIRFQNTGSASAINVNIIDKLDFFSYDLSSFQPVAASHDFNTIVSAGNLVQFEFDNINLPAQVNDDIGSNGYVIYRIKPSPVFVSIGDIISGNASIYFDFNLPILTNTVFTEVVDTLSIEELQSSSSILLFPNPTSDIINISYQKESDKINSLAIYSTNGKLLYQINKEVKNIDVSNFASGLYILKMKTNRGEVNRRFIKN
jgi:hypothetical protein